MDHNRKELDAGFPEAPGYRYAQTVGDELFVAGQVPMDSAGQLVGLGDPATQTTKCLDNLKTLIELHDFVVGDIRHLTIYVVGEQANLTTSWQSVTDWFDGPVPPATLLGVNLLGYPDQLLEIDARIKQG